MTANEALARVRDTIGAIIGDPPDMPVTDSLHGPPGADVPPVDCYACRKPTTGELWIRPDHQAAPYEWEPTYFCHECAHIPIPPDGYTIADGLDDPGTCFGCHRRFHARAHWRLYCTTTCAGRARARRYYDEHLRAAPTQHTCEACPRTFTPSRSDARYCSNACRQRAYRQRIGGGLGGANPPE